MKSTKGPKVLMAIGAFLALGPLWGLLGTIIGMVRAFTSMQMSPAAPKPEYLASSIEIALLTTVAGFIAFPIGIGLLAGGIGWRARIKREEHETSAADPHPRAGG